MQTGEIGKATEQARPSWKMRSDGNRSGSAKATAGCSENADLSANEMHYASVTKPSHTVLYIQYPNPSLPPHMSRD